LSIHEQTPEQAIVMDAALEKYLRAVVRHVIDEMRAEQGVGRPDPTLRGTITGGAFPGGLGDRAESNGSPD